MANCAQCNTTILWGAKRDGDYEFCSDKCLQKGATGPRLAAVPQDLVDQEAKKLHSGKCPRCGGSGPVDVHSSHFIWSAVYLSSWRTKPAICCRACGVKTQLMATGFSAVLGWWGFPHGVLMTPVQIFKNVKGLTNPPDPSTPSPELQRMVRAFLATRAAANPAPPQIAPISTGAASTTTLPSAKRGTPGSPFSDIGRPMR